MTSVAAAHGAMATWLLAVPQPTGFRAHAIYLVAAIPLLVAVVVAIVVWRNARRERAATELRTRLSNPDPNVRRRTLDEVTDESLAANAALLRELLARERDPEVLDALAAAVARSRWEPSNDPDLVELRRWVSGATRATRSSAEGAEPPPFDAPAPAAPGPADDAPPAAAASSPEPDAAVLAAATAAVADGDATPVDDPLDDLVPKVRALLGDELERVEMVSIDGEVLASWRAEPRATG